MSELLSIPTIKPGIYRHYKDKLYKVIGVALHSETKEALVVYTSLYKSDAEYWVRPYSMFTESVESDGKTVKRFAYVED